MSERLCHWCGSVIPDEPTFLFCDKDCFIKYRQNRDDGKIPDKPLYRDEATA